jgi:F-type H+-transporting ATPase subunit alpha
MSLDKEVTILYTVINGYLDDIPVEKINQFETEFHTFLNASYSDLLNTILTKKELSSESEETLKKAIQQFRLTFKV